MMAEVGHFPATREDLQKKLCRLSCKGCKQHELIDGTRVQGFLSKHETFGLKLAPWSEWQAARERFGDRKNQGRGYLRNLCQRC